MGAAVLAASLAAPAAGDPVAERLVGRRCLVLRYVGSHRNASFGKRDQRRPVTTIVEGPSVRYVASWLLELPKTHSLRQLAFYDARLADKPSQRGFEPGEVARVAEVKRKDDEVEVKVEGAQADDERRGRLVFKFPGGVPMVDRVFEVVWRTLLPEPPYGSEGEAARAMASVVHQMEVSRLAEWMRRPPEDVARAVAAVAPEPSGVSAEEARALFRCFEESYVWLSDRSGIALLGLSLEGPPEGRRLAVRARPHGPLLGDWRGEAERAAAGFEWTAKVLRTVPRRWAGPPLAGYRITLEYDFRGSDDDYGADRLVSVVPAGAALDYAELRLSTHALAGRAEHRLNEYPVSLGDRSR